MAFSLVALQTSNLGGTVWWPKSFFIAEVELVPLVLSLELECVFPRVIGGLRLGFTVPFESSLAID